MLDLQKYLNRAEADPGFKAKLLKNANQAIKDEFGEDLPYKLKCKEKIVFEIESMDGVAGSDLSGVAGGSAVWATPMQAHINDVGPRSTNAYRQGYGFNLPSFRRPDNPWDVRGSHSPFVRSKDDSEIRKANFDGIGTVPYVRNRRDNI